MKILNPMYNPSLPLLQPLPLAPNLKPKLNLIFYFSITSSSPLFLPPQTDQYGVWARWQVEPSPIGFATSRRSYAFFMQTTQLRKGIINNFVAINKTPKTRIQGKGLMNGRCLPSCVTSTDKSWQNAHQFSLSFLLSQPSAPFLGAAKGLFFVKVVATSLDVEDENEALVLRWFSIVKILP